MKLFYSGVRLILFVSIILEVTIFTSVFADSELYKYKLIYQGTETSISCIKNNDGIILVPLRSTLEASGHSISEECGRCGYDIVNIINNNVNDFIYIHWLENKITLSEGSREIVLDANNERHDGITYTSLEVYKYLGYELEINNSEKVLKISKKDIDSSSIKSTEKNNQPYIITEDSQTDRKIAVYFYSSTCASCKRTGEFIGNIKGNYPDVEFIEYNISDVNNILLLERYGKEYGLPLSQIGTIPAVFISRTALVDEKDIYNKLEEKVINYDSEGATKKFVLNKDSERMRQQENRILKVTAVFAAGLVNGINPCSLSMFLFFLSLLLVDGRKILKAGIAFCTGKLIVFLLLGTIFYKIIMVLEINWVSGLIKFVFLAVVIIFVVINLSDLAAIKMDKHQRVLLRLPEALRGVYHRIIKKTAKYIESRYVIVIMLFLGMILALGEFLCTGQIYLASIIILLQGDELNVVPVLYLLIYSIAFVTPLIIMTLFVYKGKKVFNLSEILLERYALIKVTSAFLFIIFGVYIFLYF